MKIEHVPVLAPDPQAEKPVLEPPGNISGELGEARRESIDQDESTSQFINLAPPSIGRKTPSLEDDDLFSVNFNECEDEWMKVDTADVPAVDSHKEEVGWENVELNTSAAICSLEGEDDYSIEPFRSSRRKEELSE